MLHEFVQQQRESRGLTQEALANELEISRQTYMLIERGDRDVTIPEARTLASVFDMSLEQFLAEQEVVHEVIFKKEFVVKPEKLQIRVEHKDLEKFKQVLLYILNEVGGKPNIGETVLHKLLYFIDFDYYEKYEQNLIGATYIKNHHGPTAVELGPIVTKMQEDGDLEVVKSKYFKRDQKKFLAIKLPDLLLLSAREVNHIDEILARLANKNARELSAYSHEDIPWKAAEEGQPIAYESVFYRDETYSVRSHEDEL